MRGAAPRHRNIRMNRYPLWKYAILRGRPVDRRGLHRAELLRRGAGGAGVQRQDHGQDRPRLCAARAADAGASRPEARLRAVRRQLGEGAAGRHRRTDQGQGRAQRGAEPGSGRPVLHRRAEPAVALAGLAGRPARAADVPGAGPARRRVLPDAGGHEGGADASKAEIAGRRHPPAAARPQHPPRRHHPRRRRGARCGCATRPR